jgi:hypothetical protein
MRTPLHYAINYSFVPEGCLDKPIKQQKQLKLPTNFRLSTLAQQE